MPVPKAAMSLPCRQYWAMLFWSSTTWPIPILSATNDPSQVAALTLLLPIFMTLIALGNLFGIGANSIIARSLGAKNYDMARRSATWSVVFRVIIT
jgi:Na+-driven multidrug efflux pump